MRSSGERPLLTGPPVRPIVSRVDPFRTYRTRLSLRIAVALAAVFWAGMLVAVLRAPGSGAGAGAAFAAGGFTAFFLACYVLYQRSSITVTREGIVAASPLRRRPVAYDDILQIVVRDGLGGRVYAVFTRRGVVQFTSLFGRHRELFETLLERSDLAPRFV